MKSYDTMLSVPGQNIGMSPSGKAPDFDSGIRRFKSGHPSQHDPLAQLAEQLPFKQWVRGSNPRRVTKKRKLPHSWGLSFLISPRGDSNPSNGDVRWTSPRASSKTGPLHSGIESPAGHPNITEKRVDRSTLIQFVVLWYGYYKCSMWVHSLRLPDFPTWPSPHDLHGRKAQ